jgi:hypothetical protein
MQISNRLVKYLVLSVFALLLGGQVNRVNAQNWYNTSWAYRTPVTVTNSTGGTLTNFQVRVTLDGGFDFTKALSTGADLRVTDSNGTSLLSFWIESWSQTNSTASIWVLVPSIPISGVTIYLYYGNPSATTASSGSATFILFDDFEGTTTAAQGYWTLSSASDSGLTQDSWDTSVPHSMSVVTAPASSTLFPGYTYWTYYGDYNACAGVGLAGSTNLTSWTKYASNPLSIGKTNARWPSVLSSGGTYYMAYTVDYCSTTATPHIELATATDGITFTDSGTALVAANANGHTRNQNPNLFYNPLTPTTPYYLYYYSGDDSTDYEIHARSAATVAGLATATDVTVLTSNSAVLAAPNMFCLDSTSKAACTASTTSPIYFLSTESRDSGGSWNVQVWASTTSPTSGFQLVPAVNSGDISAVMADNSACMSQYQFGTSLHLWYCNLNGSTWTVQHRSATISATRPTYQQPNSATWTNVGGGAWAVIQDTDENGLATGHVAKGMMVARQALHSVTQWWSPSDLVVDAYGKQISGNTWGIGARASVNSSVTPPTGVYYSTQLYDNQVSPNNNLFLYGWLWSGASELAAANIGTVSPNTWYRLREAVHGSNVYSYKDDALQLSATEDSLTGGGVALYGEGTTIAEYNNVLVRQYASADPTTTPGTTPSLVLSSVTLTCSSPDPSCSSGVTGGSTPYPTGKVTLAGAASANLTVTLASDTPTVASVPASVTVSSGQTTSPNFTVTTYAVTTATQVTITASYHGASVQTTLTVNPAAQAPAITSASSTTFTVGTAGSFSVTTTGQPKPTLTETGTLPSGVTFTDNGDRTATLAGTPGADAGGTHPITITAQNGILPDATQNFTLTVNNPVPTITGLSPSSVTAGAAAQTLTITGTNFVSTSTVTYNSVAHTPTFVDSTHLTISLTVADQATGGNYPVVVTNPAPGGGASNSMNFTVNNPLPTVASLSPSSALVGAAAQTLTITGTNFLSTSTVTYNAVAHTPTFVDAEHLTISLTEADQATAGSFAVVVTNPTPGGGSSTPVNFAINNPVPTITSLSPSSAVPGAAAQTLTINGTGFLTSSTVTYNSVAHTATFVDSTHLTILLTTGDQATPGTFPVVVTNPTPGGGSSAPVNFTVSNPVPTITSLSPPSVIIGAATAQTLTITGTGFLSSSTVTYNSVAHTATFVDSTHLTISLSLADQAAAGNFAVIVTNPAPGGGSSTPVNFVVLENPAPTITSLSPSSALAGAAAQTLTITGTGFLSISTVTYNSVAHTPSFVDSTHLTISLTAADQATGGNYPLVVTNPAPGGGPSNSMNFTVNNLVPTITNLSPPSATAGAAAQTVTVTGTNFLTTSTVTYNAVAHTATFVDAEHLSILLTTADQATGGNYPVVVTNPAPGGGPSNSMNFTVNNPVPTITSLSPASGTTGAAAQTLTIIGTNFVSTSTVTYNSVAHTATYVDSTHLTISLTAADQAAAGTFPVVVTNPPPSGGASNSVNFAVNNGVPTITSLSPPSAVVGSAGETVTIIGTNFIAASTVTYNSVAHTPTPVDSTHLTISLSTSDLATAGDFPVVVTNPAPGGGSSSPVNFGVGNPIPAITSLSPSSALAGAAAQTLTITGTDFMSTSTVTYNSVAHTLSFVDSTHLTISLTAADQATAGNYPVVVTNPTPGGGASTPVNFTVNNPAPAVTTLSPSSSVAGAAAQTMTITGTGFVSTSTVTYGGAAHAATFVSATQLTLSLSASDQAAAGTYPIVVTNSTPGGGSSTPVNFTIQSFEVGPASGQQTSQTVNAGVTATYNLSLSSPDGLTGSATLTCTGAPSAATCTPTSPANIPGTATVTVTTTSRAAVPIAPKPPTGPWVWLWILALAAAAGTRLLAGRRLAWNRAWAPLAVAMLSVALLAGCGGGGGGTPTPHGTPAGTYPLTVTATYTSGATTAKQTVALTLKVN